MKDELDEFIVMREMAIVSGRAIVMLASAALTVFFPLRTVFVLAAVVSVGMGLISRFAVPSD